MYNKLKTILKQRGLSKLQLALKAGINPSDLYAALNGSKPLFPAWRKKIGAALAIPEAELFEEGDCCD
jgi:predicted transcriptional regulator